MLQLFAPTRWRPSYRVALEFPEEDPKRILEYLRALVIVGLLEKGGERSDARYLLTDVGVVVKEMLTVKHLKDIDPDYEE